jgi:hypothetical protein
MSEEPTTESGKAGRRTSKNEISDFAFMESLRTLKRLRSFVVQKAIALPKGFELAELNLLKHDSVGGRSPSAGEWTAVETKTQILYDMLEDEERALFVRSGIPGWVVRLAAILTVLAAGALVAAAALQTVKLIGVAPVVGYLPTYILWVVSLGSIGSVAFVGMNALSVQDDITFDMSNGRLIALRIVLGGLFALILTLPFGYDPFFAFIRGIAGNCLDCARIDPSATKLTLQAVLLLMPFVLGFSTSLVIMILNRLVDSVQAFFGKAVGGADTKKVRVRKTLTPTKPAVVEQTAAD